MSDSMGTTDCERGGNSEPPSVQKALLSDPWFRTSLRTIDRAQARVLIKRLADIGKVGPLCAPATDLDSEGLILHIGPAKGVLLGVLVRRFVMRLSCEHLTAIDVRIRNQRTVVFAYRSQGIPAI